MINPDPCEYLDVDGVQLAMRRHHGDGLSAAVIWLGGFHSDMLGEKASTLHDACVATGRSFLRFDYYGHGESGGVFADGTIGRWRDDTLAMIDQMNSSRLVLVGSSMGAWMALLSAIARPVRIAGLCLLAPAPDFTERLMWDRFSSEQKREIMEAGSWTRPSPYDAAGYPITRALIEDGRKWLVLDQPHIDFDGPVRVLHGGRDEDVPLEHSRQLVDKLRSNDVVWTLIKDADHRLSRPQDIARLVDEVLKLADQIDRSATS